MLNQSLVDKTNSTTRSKIGRELTFTIIFLLSIVVFLPYLLTSSKFYVSSITLDQAQFGDAPGAIWTLWLYSQQHSSFNTIQLNEIIGGRSLWELQTYSQAIWISGGALLNQFFEPIRAFNTLVLINFYLAARASLFAARTVTNKSNFDFFAIIICTTFPFIVWAVGGPTAITGFFPIPLLIGLLIKLSNGFDIRIVALAIGTLAISALSEFVVFQSCLFILAAYLTKCIYHSSHKFSITLIALFVVITFFFLVRAIIPFEPRSIDELAWFGGRWWHVLLPPNETPLVGDFFKEIRNSQYIQNYDTNSTLNYPATLLFPGFNLFVYLGLFIARKRSKLSKESFGPHKFLVTLVLYSVIFQVFTVSIHWSRYLMPSAWLQIVMPITRYSGRFTLLTHVAIGLLVVKEMNCFVKSNWDRKKIKSVVVTAIFISVSILDVFPSYKGRNASAIDQADIPPAYEYLKLKDSAAYIDLPPYENKFPFPSFTFQYFTQQPVLHSSLVDKSKADLINRLALDSTNYCSNQTGRWMYKLGFQYLVIHEDLMPSDYSLAQMEECGFELVFKPSSEPSYPTKAYADYQTSVVYKILPKKQISGIAFPATEFVLVEGSEASNPTYSSPNKRSRIDFESFGTTANRSFSLRTNQNFRAFCSGDQNNELVLEPDTDRYKMVIPSQCEYVIIEKSLDIDLRISELLLF